MPKLVIGYGNPSRNDDGVGLAVVNHLRQRLGLSSLDGDDSGFSDLGRDLDTLFLQQLTPELAETLAAYDSVFFVDAHVATFPEMVRRTPIREGMAPAMVSHHVRPEGLLALARLLYGRAPAAELLSIRGSDFDFGTCLSPATAAAAQDVADELWASAGAHGVRDS